MNESAHPSPSPPNQFGRNFLLSLTEVLGQAGINAVLNRAELGDLIDAFPDDNQGPLNQPDLFSRVGEALEGLYGLRGGRGLALRAGRASFQRCLRQFGAEAGLEDVEFRLLPLEQKIHRGLNQLAALVNRYWYDQVIVAEDETFYYWNVRGCPFCFQRQASDPVCHFMVGYLQSALYWLSGGKFYAVQEQSCAASGDPQDVIRIDKKPLD
jgi:predicted hydrocarbon binding protein